MVWHQVPSTRYVHREQNRKSLIFFHGIDHVVCSSGGGVSTDRDVEETEVLFKPVVLSSHSCHGEADEEALCKTIGILLFLLSFTLFQDSVEDCSMYLTTKILMFLSPVVCWPGI